MFRDDFVFLTDAVPVKRDSVPELSTRSKEERLAVFHTRRLMRIAFYADLNRRPPTKVAHMPSYVRAVKEKWDLKFNNSARQLLAEIEGFRSWEDLMAAE